MNQKATSTTATKPSNKPAMMASAFSLTAPNASTQPYDADHGEQGPHCHVCFSGLDRLRRVLRLLGLLYLLGYVLEGSTTATRAAGVHRTVSLSVPSGTAAVASRRMA